MHGWGEPISGLFVAAAVAALAGYLVTEHTGSPWLGLLGGLATGAVCGAIIAAVVLDVGEGARLEVVDAKTRCPFTRSASQRCDPRKPARR